MSYIRENLTQDEKIIYETKLHWIIYYRAFWWLVITLLLMLFGPSNRITSFEFVPGSLTLYQISAIITFFAAAFCALSAYVTYISMEFALTNKRVWMKAGFIRRVTQEIPLFRIESVNIYQSMLGRLFGYGNLIINGIGGSHDLFQKFPEPAKLRKLIQDQIEKTGTLGSPNFIKQNYANK